MSCSLQGAVSGASGYTLAAQPARASTILDVFDSSHPTRMLPELVRVNTGNVDSGASLTASGVKKRFPPKLIEECGD